MPIAKLRTNTLDALKPMADNSVNTYIRQAAGNESLLSFSRTGDTPVQWFQLLNALDQPDLQGWPFMTHVKIQMQKCDKCSKEFCSPINYRRHIRVHRRSLRANKEWHKNRDLLAAFWDKLSSEAAKEIVSFDDVTLEEVSGSSIIWSLTSFVRKPGYNVFPLQYVKAGSALLDIIQNRPARLPISSQELFAILDEASEGTFLCAGTAESMQKFVFDGEAGKIGTDPKNIVACTSFLIEQKLVRYWVADMDAESLRCQQLLVEEEEAAQRRQAKILERKRQKKLRQKEQKAEIQGNGETVELEEEDTVLTPDRPSSSEPTNPSVSSESSSNFIDTAANHPFSFSLSLDSTSIQEHTDVEPQNGFASEASDTGPYPNIENQSAFGSDRKQSNGYRWQVQKPQRTRNGYGPPRDQRPTQVVSGHKIWTRKPKTELDNGKKFNTRVQKTTPNCERKLVEQAETSPKPNPEHDNVESVSAQIEKEAPRQSDQNCEVIGSKRKPEHENGKKFDPQVLKTTPSYEPKPVEKAETAPKPKPEHDNVESVSTQVEKEAPTQSQQSDQNCEVIIGSKRKPEHENGKKFNTRGQKTAPNCEAKPVEEAETAPKPKPEHDNVESVGTQLEREAPSQSHRMNQNCEVINGSKRKPEHENGKKFNTLGKKTASNCDPKPVEKAETAPKPKPDHDNVESVSTQVEREAPIQSHQTCQICEVIIDFKEKQKHENGDNLSSQVQKEAPTKSHQTNQNCEVVIGSKRKSEHENGDSLSSQVEKEAPTESQQADQNCEVMIGSISVTLGKKGELPASVDRCQEKYTETCGGVSRSKVKLWRPVSRHGNRGGIGGGEPNEDIVRESDEKAVLSESCQKACDSDGNDPQEGTTQPEGFSTEAAKALLAQRWKEATAGEHVTLILTPETEVFDSQDAENDDQVTKTPAESQTRIVLENADNLQENILVIETSTNRKVKDQSKTNPEKGGVKTKHIPKKKTATKGK